MVQQRKAYAELQVLKQGDTEQGGLYWQRAVALRMDYELHGGLINTVTFLGHVQQGLKQPEFEWFHRMQMGAINRLTQDEYGALLTEYAVSVTSLNPHLGAAFYGQAGRYSPKPKPDPGGHQGNQNARGQHTPGWQGRKGREEFPCPPEKWGQMGPALNGGCQGCHRPGHWRGCWSRPGRVQGDREKGAIPKHLSKQQQQQRPNPKGRAHVTEGLDGSTAEGADKPAADRDYNLGEWHMAVRVIGRCHLADAKT